MKTSSMKKEKLETQNKGLFLNPVFEIILFVGIHILIFGLLYHTLYKIQYSATGLYFDYASKVMHGSLPYRDFSFEYPPFSLLFFILPRLLASTWLPFSVFYQIEVVIVDLLGLFLVNLIARRLGKAPWTLMTVYTLCILAIGPITGQQFDIFPAVMTLAAIYFFWLGRHQTSWVLLALGTLTKIYPLAIAPILLLIYLKNRQYKQLASGLGIFAVICLVVVIPFLYYGSESIFNLVNYHAQRGIQLESTYSAILLALRQMGLIQVNWVFNFGSINLDSPLANTVAKMSTFISALALIITYWFIWSRIKPGKSQFTRLAAYSLLVIDVVLVTSKVLSPQYLIWLVPLFPLLFGPWRYHITAIFLIIGILTYFIFPLNYEALEYFKTDAIALLVFRDLLLILLAVILGLSLQHMKPSD
jgi:uncharacterized membrane protein